MVDRLSLYRPFALQPNRVWRTYLGGKLLDEMEGKEFPIDSHFPEDWIASTTRAINRGREHLKGEGISKIEIDGKDILFPELIKSYPYEVLGRGHVEVFGLETAVLVKLLDSAIRLHIQVHPTISYAQRYLGSSRGKTEAYIILAHRKDIHPYIYLGFQCSPSREEWRRVIEKQDINRMLSFFNPIPARPGDVFIVHGGIPHAIGEGLLMVEIMEPTDFVVRCEFQRGEYILPESARFMNLGLEQALDMFDYTSYPIEEVKKRFRPIQRVIKEQKGGREMELITSRDTHCFRANRLEVWGKFEAKNPENFCIGIVVNGKGRLMYEDGFIEMTRGKKFFLPACLSNFSLVAEKENTLEIIMVMPPEPSCQKSKIPNAS